MYKNIFISDIVLDSTIANTISQLDPNIDLSPYTILKNPIGNTLERISNFYPKLLYPIHPIKCTQKQLYTHPNSQSPRYSYQIVDGRHRVAYHILKNIKEISVKIIK